jgi:hypothetical protein
MKPIKITRSEIRSPSGPERRYPIAAAPDPGLTMCWSPAALEDLGVEAPSDEMWLVVHPDGTQEWTETPPPSATP